jgi:hypothetical protein
MMDRDRWDRLRSWVESERDELMDPVDRDQYQLVLDKMDELERTAAPIEGKPEVFVNGVKRDAETWHVEQQLGGPATAAVNGEDLGYCMVRYGELREFVNPMGRRFKAPCTVHIDQVTWDQWWAAAKRPQSGADNPLTLPREKD